jgi:pimeloyl-ACP methyl ester carboxylesterase
MPSEFKGMPMPLFVDETGTPGAPSIVFLHGIGTSGWMWWQQTAALNDFHCLNVDLPGHGKSTHIPWVSLADTAHQIAAIIQSRATQGQSHMVGLSLGGQIALILLEYHARLLNRVVLSGVTVAPMPNRHMLHPQLWLMSAVMRRRWFLNMQAKALNLPSNQQTAFVENFLAMSMCTYRRIAEEVVEYRMPSTLQQVSVPTLATAGGKESQIILQAVDMISNIMPIAQGWLAPGLGHGWNVESPDLFNTMVRAWITNTPLPAELKAAHDSRIRQTNL